jgi:large subunit ribosomal protein L2
MVSYTNAIFSFILAPHNLLPSVVVANINLRLNQEDRLGYSAYLKFIKPGVYINSVEYKPLDGATYVRAASSYGKLVSSSFTHSILKLRSKVLLRVSSSCVATVGILSNKL